MCISVIEINLNKHVSYLQLKHRREIILKYLEETDYQLAKCNSISEKVTDQC